MVAGDYTSMMLVVEEQDAKSVWAPVQAQMEAAVAMALCSLGRRVVAAAADEADGYNSHLPSHCGLHRPHHVPSSEEAAARRARETASQGCAGVRAVDVCKMAASMCCRTKTDTTCHDFLGCGPQTVCLCRRQNTKAQQDTVLRVRDPSKAEVLLRVV